MRNRCCYFCEAALEVSLSVVGLDVFRDAVESAIHLDGLKGHENSKETKTKIWGEEIVNTKLSTCSLTKVIELGTFPGVESYHSAGCFGRNRL